MLKALANLKTQFPALNEEAASGCLIVPSEAIKKVCSFLKQDLGFEHLMCLTSLDYKDRLALVYNLYSYPSQEKISLKVFLDKNNPNIESLSGIWPAANWQEREAFDLMGINFSGHPDLKRILLPDDWTGHPLRKDYTREGFVPMPPI